MQRRNEPCPCENNSMFTAHSIALNLNRALLDHPEKLNKLIYEPPNKRSIIGELNHLLEDRGETWRILVVFADRDNTIIKRFDIIDLDSDAQIVIDSNPISWFKKY